MIKEASQFSKISNKQCYETQLAGGNQLAVNTAETRTTLRQI